jgi:hypothetical protein
VGPALPARPECPLRLRRGISSTFESNAPTYDDQVAKPRLIVETARDIWDD